jgi:hypothetical protein
MTGVTRVRAVSRTQTPTIEHQSAQRSYCLPAPVLVVEIAYAEHRPSRATDLAQELLEEQGCVVSDKVRVTVPASAHEHTGVHPVIAEIVAMAERQRMFAVASSVWSRHIPQGARNRVAMLCVELDGVRASTSVSRAAADQQLLCAELTHGYVLSPLTRFSESYELGNSATAERDAAERMTEAVLEAGVCG